MTAKVSSEVPETWIVVSVQEARREWMLSRREAQRSCLSGWWRIQENATGNCRAVCGASPELSRGEPVQAEE